MVLLDLPLLGFPFCYLLVALFEDVHKTNSRFRIYLTVYTHVTWPTFRCTLVFLVCWENVLSGSHALHFRFIRFIIKHVNLYVIADEPPFDAFYFMNVTLFDYKIIFISSISYV